MQKNLIISIRLTLIMIILCAVIYPVLIAAVGTLAPGQGKGKTLTLNGRVVGYEHIGQQFTHDNYFWGRPSAVNYNAAVSAGSNKGPSNPDYLEVVKARVDSFLVHHPGVTKQEIPSEMVTASGSGLDPHISPASALIQVRRVAAARGMTEQQLIAIIEQHTDKHMFRPAVVNVLKLNIALEELKK